MVALVYSSDGRCRTAPSAAITRSGDSVRAAKRSPAKRPGRRVQWANLAVQIPALSAAEEAKIPPLCNGFSNCLCPRQDENKGRATAMEGLSLKYSLP